MNTLVDVMDQIRSVLKRFAGETLHGHQVKALAMFALCMARSQHCHISRLAAFGADGVKPLSRQRRFQRFLANTRVHVEAVMTAVMVDALAGLAGCRVLLYLDETPLANDLRCMKVSICWRGRAIPLVWRCYRCERDAAALPRRQLVEHLLTHARNMLPASAEVIVLCDRGLTDTHLIDLARRFAWHFLLRAQHQTRVRVGVGAGAGAGAAVVTCSFGQLQQQHGTWLGSGQAFQDAGWRDVNLVAVAAAQAGGDPWLLVTDLDPTRACCQLYRKRMWQEQSFRDEKSSGFQWHKSKVLLPDHAQRLLLVMAIAQLMLLIIGADAVKRGERTLFEPSKRRRFSVYQIGYRCLVRAIDTARSISITLRLPHDCMGHTLIPATT